MAERVRALQVVELSMKVKIKLTVVYRAVSLDDSEKMLALWKRMTNPLVFNADVRQIEES